MKKQYLIQKGLIWVWGLLAMSIAYAGAPLWTLTPLTATTITVPSTGTATIKYQVTNQSRKAHTLVMSAIPGITQVTTPGNCPNPFVLGYQQSCVLNLTVVGSVLTGDVVGGPALCNQSNPLQCYEPCNDDKLNITREGAEYTVGGSVIGLDGTLILQNNGGDALTITANGTFTFSNPLKPGSTYAVTVQTQPLAQVCTVANGNGTISNANITNVEVTCVSQQTTLTTSHNELALSMTGLVEFGITGTPNSGLPRIITITNTGSYPTINLSVNYPSWPAGTTASTTCSNTLLAGGSCTITITPGATATSDGANPCTVASAPIPGVINVNADNAGTVSSNVVVLGYGCIYQGGHVFAFDDTTPNTSSVGGKVATTSNQAPPFPLGVVWSSNGTLGGGGGGDAPSAVSNDVIPGIDDFSTSSTPLPTFSDFSSFFAATYNNINPFTPASFAACDGLTVGKCNSPNILTFYNEFITNFNALGAPPYFASPGPTPSTYYAAGLCTATINSYSDWYLPALCELGYDDGSTCGTPTDPLLQNMQSDLVDYNNLNLLSGYFWSSTEYVASPSVNAWFQSFAPNGGGFHTIISKSHLLGVRCARLLTT